MTDLQKMVLAAAREFIGAGKPLCVHDEIMVVCDECLAAAMLEFAAKLDGWHALARVDETHVPERCAACQYVRNLRDDARELREGKP